MSRLSLASLARRSITLARRIQSGYDWNPDELDVLEAFAREHGLPV